MSKFIIESLGIVVVGTFLFVGRQAIAADQPDLSKWIDRRFEEHFEELGTSQPSVVDDATFLRRVYLDLVGRIPSAAQVRDFVADSSELKRLRVIEQLLASERFNKHMARTWRRILISSSSSSAPGLVTTLDGWLAEQMANNTPFNKLVGQLLTAGGAAQLVGSGPESDENGASEISSAPVVYLQSAGGQPAGMASSVTRIFLGVRLECAQCHDHPFTDWKQEDFWGIAAFFSGAQLTSPLASRPTSEQSALPIVDRHSTTILDQDGNSYSVSLPWRGSGEIEIPETQLPRQFFADWMTSNENPYFAATAVNRIWQHLCGEGLTDSVDNLDQATARERGVILDDLAGKFAESGFDTKALMKAVCASNFYQRSSERDQISSVTAVRPLKVLTPEQLFDSLEIALALPISRIDKGPRYNGLRDALVSRMEEALGERPDDFRGGIPQALSLMNGTMTTDATDLKKSRTLRAIIDAPFLDDHEKLDTLFLTTLSRHPHDSEKERFFRYIQHKNSGHTKSEALSDIMWALINSPEFVLIK